MASVLTRIVKGAIAGAAGTLAMDLFRYARARQGGSDASFRDWEFSSTATSFDDAPAPAKVARLATDRIGVELPGELAGAANNVMHWTTGAGYGIAHGLLHQAGSGPLAGMLTGVGAFANSYATLGALGVYEPMWEYEPAELAEDLAGHLAYGLATGLVYRALTRNDTG